MLVLASGGPIIFLDISLCFWALCHLHLTTLDISVISTGVLYIWPLGKICKISNSSRNHIAKVNILQIITIGLSDFFKSLMVQTREKVPNKSGLFHVNKVALNTLKRDFCI